MTSKRKGFTLIEIMIVIMVIAVLLGIAIPNFMSSRAKSHAQSCVANLRQIRQAKEQAAMASSMNDGDTMNESDLTPYIKSAMPTCPAGGTYTIGIVGYNPTCSKETNPIPHILP